MKTPVEVDKQADLLEHPTLRPRTPVSFRAQMVTTVKLLAATSGVGLVLWLLDRMVSS
jgi:hypothetical protein